MAVARALVVLVLLLSLQQALCRRPARHAGQAALADAHKHARKVLLPSRVLDTERAWADTRCEGCGSDEPHSVYMVHLERPDLRADVEAWTGLQFGDYVPHNTFLLLATEREAALASKAPGVLWVGPLEARDKRDGRAEAMARGGNATAEWAVVLAAGRTLRGAPYGPRRDAAAGPLLRRWEEALSRRLGRAASVRLARPAHGGEADGSVLRVSLGAPDARGAALAFLASRPGVLWVQPVAPMGLRMRYAAALTQSADGGTPVWTGGLTGAGEVVGAGDDGLDFDMCMFRERDGTNPPRSQVNNNRRKVILYMIAAGASISGPSEHGTRAVGTMAGYASRDFTPTADPGALTTIGQYSGLARDAKVVFTDYGDASGTLPGLPDPFQEQVLQAQYDAGVRVHLVTWGCKWSAAASCNYYGEGENAIDRFAFRRPDMLIVVAAGNDGWNGPRTIGAPATCKNCLVVGASQTSNAAFAAGVAYSTKADCCATASAPDPTCCDKIPRQEPTHYDQANVAGFSSRGPTFDGRIKPDLVAVGQSVVAAMSDNDVATMQCDVGRPLMLATGSRQPSSLALDSGTSIAAALAASAAALVRQFLREGKGAPAIGALPAPSSALVKALLINGARRLGGLQGYPRPEALRAQEEVPVAREMQGFGRLDLSTTLPLGGASSPAWLLVRDSEAFPVGGPYAAAYYVPVAQAANVKVTLVWTDVSGGATTQRVLTNDLDLVVYVNDVPSLGNGGATRDSLNNVEQVEASGVVGNVTVVVLGTNLPLPDAQRYALVVTSLPAAFSATLAPPGGGGASSSSTSSSSSSSSTSTGGGAVDGTLAPPPAVEYGRQGEKPSGPNLPLIIGIAVPVGTCLLFALGVAIYCGSRRRREGIRPAPAGGSRASVSELLGKEGAGASEPFPRTTPEPTGRDPEAGPAAAFPSATLRGPPPPGPRRPSRTDAPRVPHGSRPDSATVSIAPSGGPSITSPSVTDGTSRPAHSRPGSGARGPAGSLRVAVVYQVGEFGEGTPTWRLPAYIRVRAPRAAPRPPRRAGPGRGGRPREAARGRRGLHVRRRAGGGGQAGRAAREGRLRRHRQDHRRPPSDLPRRPHRQGGPRRRPRRPRGPHPPRRHAPAARDRPPHPPRPLRAAGAGAGGAGGRGGRRHLPPRARLPPLRPRRGRLLPPRALLRRRARQVRLPLRPGPLQPRLRAPARRRAPPRGPCRGPPPGLRRRRALRPRPSGPPGIGRQAHSRGCGRRLARGGGGGCGGGVRPSVRAARAAAAGHVGGRPGAAGDGRAAAAEPPRDARRPAPPAPPRLPLPPGRRRQARRRPSVALGRMMAPLSSSPYDDLE